MIKLKHSIGVLLLLLMCSGGALAQNNTNSPYTRYGYGQLEDPTPSNSKGMAGVAYGMRDRYHVNFANPASYTAVDSVTFIFDGGVTLQNTNFSNGILKQNAKNSSFDYIVMEFRAAKWAGISLGLLPYSNIGYNISETRTIENSEEPYAVTYTGDGGLHQLYLGAGFKLLKNLSVGANFSYLWGDLNRGLTESFSSSSSINNYAKTTTVAVKSYKLDFGVQYSLQLAKKHALTLGAVFSPGHDLNNTSSVYTQTGNDTNGYVAETRDTTLVCGIPTTIGFGATYVYDGRLTVGMDAMLQNWNDVTFMNQKEALCKRGKIALGAEYYPNPQGRSYFSHIKYRLGAYYSKPYYKIGGERAADEYGVTAGLGLLIPRTRSYLNLSAQYVRTKGSKMNLLDENTFRICVGVTFNERWFFKRVVE